jgi:digeranylgeranylglycerophospholipid reductase
MQEQMEFDIIIVGGGGAGLMAGRELGKRGLKTLIIDRKSDLLDFTFNTLGSFMNIDDFGLTENVIARKVKSVILYSKHFKRVVTCEGSVLDKRKLHEELLNTINTDYVTVLTDTAIKAFTLTESGDIASITDQHGSTYTATYFIDATGVSGFFSKAFGLQEKKPRLGSGVEYNVKYKGKTDEAHMLIGKMYEGGYGWIFPLQNDRAIIGFGSFDDLVLKELKKRLDTIIAMPHIARLVEKDTDKPEGGNVPVTPVLDKFVHHNLVCIGDSVSQINPIVGEGYKFIFESVLFAVDAIEKALRNQDRNFLTEYEENWKKRFLSNYQFSKYLQDKVFRFSKSDFLVDMGVLYLKYKKDEKVLKVISGEYNRDSHN